MFKTFPTMAQNRPKTNMVTFYKQKIGIIYKL